MIMQEVRVKIDRPLQSDRLYHIIGRQLFVGLCVEGVRATDD